MFSNVEAKVASTSLTTLGASVVVAVLNAVGAHSEMLGSLPALAQFIILSAIPPIVTFAAGYITQSTARPDLWNYAGPVNVWSPPLPEPPLQHGPVMDEPFQTRDFRGYEEFDRRPTSHRRS